MLKFAIKFIVSGSLLAILIAHVDSDVSRRIFDRAIWPELISATLILIALIPVLAWRWLRIARGLGISLKVSAAIVIVMVGMFFNQVLPSAIGGDVVRLWMLKNAHIPIAKGFSSILLDRVIALFGMILIVAFGFPWLATLIPDPVVLFAAGIAIVSGFAGMMLLIYLDKIPMPKAKRIDAIVGKLRDLGADARSIFANGNVAIGALVASMVIHLLVSIAVWILAQGLGVNVGIEVFVLLLPLVLLLSLLPISIAGWGVREGTMVACLGLAGVDASSAFAVSALFGIAQFFAGLPGGIVWLLLGSKTKLAERT